MDFLQNRNNNNNDKIFMGKVLKCSSHAGSLGGYRCLYCTSITGVDD